MSTKGLARELKVPVWSVSQVNRAERAVRDERAARTADQADAYALQLAGILGNNPPPSAAASTPTPMPTTVPMPSTPASSSLLLTQLHLQRVVWRVCVSTPAVMCW